MRTGTRVSPSWQGLGPEAGYVEADRSRRTRRNHLQTGRAIRFLDSFSYALREELKDTGVTVTCLMPGATETEFFRRADMLDTKVGTDKKDDPDDVAKNGFKAMMSGEGGVVSGWQNKLEAAAAHVIPSERLAKKHSEMAAPGTAKK